MTPLYRSFHIAEIKGLAGEVFGGIEVATGCCDSSALLEALAAPQADIPSVLSVVEGPWALAFWQQDAQTLWVARDPIGALSIRRHHIMQIESTLSGVLLLWASCSIPFPFEGTWQSTFIMRE